MFWVNCPFKKTNRVHFNFTLKMVWRCRAAYIPLTRIQYAKPFLHNSRDVTYLLARVRDRWWRALAIWLVVVLQRVSLQRNQFRLAPRHTHNITSWWITLMEYTIWSSSFKAIWWMDPKLFRVRAPRSDWGPIHNKDCCQVQGLNYRRLLAKQATVFIHFLALPSATSPTQKK